MLRPVAGAIANHSQTIGSEAGMYR
jgi:hypothetical protein